MPAGRSRLRALPEVPPRAILYLRQSVAREESISLELQEQVNRDYCVQRGYTVSRVISDRGVSGLKWEKRPGVQEALRAVQSREADVVIVYRWSRLSRRRLHQAVALDMIERAGARVESSTEPFDTSTAGGEFGRDVLLAAAHYESRQKAEQWAEAHARRVAHGLPPTGGDRFGYTRDPEDRSRYRVDPVTGPVLKMAYRMYVDGAGFTAVAVWLNRQGLRTRGGRMFTRDRVTRILDSGWAAGLIVAGRGEQVTYTLGAHPAVVDEDLWRAYRAARDRRRGMPPRTIEPVYPLSGLVRCGDCEAPMHATRLGSGKPGYAYVCSRWATTGEGRCVTVTRAKVERAVMGWLGEWADDVDEARRRDVDRAAAALIAKTDARGLARQVGRLDQRLTKLTLDHNEGLVPDSAYVSARDELLAMRAEVAARLGDAEEDQRARAAPGRPVVEKLLDEWDTLPLRSRRDALAKLIRRVLVVRPPEQGPVTVRIEPR